MIKQLIKLANHLDKKGLQKEADYLDAIISKYAQSGDIAAKLQKILDGTTMADPNDGSNERTHPTYMMVATAGNLMERVARILIEGTDKETAAKNLNPYADEIPKLISLREQGLSNYKEETEKKIAELTEVYNRIDEAIGRDRVWLRGPLNSIFSALNGKSIGFEIK